MGPLVTALAGLLAAATAVAADEAPWRIAQALGLPDWLTLSGTHRTRYESLDGQFRAGGTGGDQIVVLATTLLAEIRHGGLKFGAEMLDARAGLNDRGTPIGTTIVNPVELLQAYASWTRKGLFTPGGQSEIRAGRLTMDVGGRRLVARNRFRNTTNSFTGADWRWIDTDGREARVFFTLPVNIQPDTAAEQFDDDIEFDEEDAEVRFWGLYYAVPRIPWVGKGEFYIFGLNENDSPGRPTRNRDLYTPGVRLYRPPAKRQFDYVFESAWQFGESRATTAGADTADLDHFAHFQHIEIGYTFDAAWSPQLIAQYDYASGDDDPADGDTERFDTLFGARRFDFGPTGIYGAFARSNLSTPGMRLKFEPAPQIDAFVAYRGYWLASDQDAWTAAGVRDPSGRSGSFIGQQIEAALTWEVAPKNYVFEAGFAHLFDAEFMRDAPNASLQGDASYFYTHVLFYF